MLNEITTQQKDYIALWYLVQHSLSAFEKLLSHFGSVAEALTAANLQRWDSIGLHSAHLERARHFLAPEQQHKFQYCLQQVQQHSDFILLDIDPHYPKQLLPYPDHPPLLFGKGRYQNLSQAQIAIVGSRKPSPHGKQIAYDFAYYLSDQGFYITSGLAQGIDEAAHQGGLQHGRTIAVVATGLDITYPSQHRHLQEQILQHAGTILTEFLPGTKPLQHHFPRRNRIVSALSLGVLVAEAQAGSGSLITAQAAAQQGKIIFAIPGHIYAENYQGCHQLIREGAILVDHPEQIIEDLALPTQWQYQQHQKSHHPQAQPAETQASLQIMHVTTDTALVETPTEAPASALPATDIPAHLYTLYQQLDWHGQDLDQLALGTQLDAATLISQLMELELLGLCKQQSGRYLRCRSPY